MSKKEKPTRSPPNLGSLHSPSLFEESKFSNSHGGSQAGEDGERGGKEAGGDWQTGPGLCRWHLRSLPLWSCPSS